MVTKHDRSLVLRAIANHAFAIGVILVLTFAQVDARISPFAIAFLFACLYMPVNIGNKHGDNAENSAFRPECKRSKCK